MGFALCARPLHAVIDAACQTLIDALAPGDQKSILLAYTVPRLHDGLDLHDLAFLEFLKDRPVLVGRTVRIFAIFSTLITLEI